MPQEPKPGDAPFMTYDKKRANREMSQPILSQANKDTMKAPIRAAGGFIAGARKAGQQFMSDSRDQIRRLRSGKR